MNRLLVGVSVVLLATTLIASASAYSVDLDVPEDEVLPGAVVDIPLTVTVDCQEIASYGNPSAETVRFAIEYTLADGLSTEAPGLMEIDRQVCLSQPQGTTDGELTVPIDVSLEAPGLATLSNSILVTPNDDAGTMGPAETVPPEQPAEEFDLEIAYVADVDVEVGLPLVKSKGAWVYLYMECKCNAPTHVEFKPVDDDSGAASPAPVFIEDVSPGQNFGDGLVYLPRSVLNNADSWTFEAVPYADADPSATGEKVTVTVTVEEDDTEGGKSTPAPGAVLAVATFGVAAALRRRQ